MLSEALGYGSRRLLKKLTVTLRHASRNRWEYLQNSLEMLPEALNDDFSIVKVDGIGGLNKSRKFIFFQNFKTRVKGDSRLSAAQSRVKSMIRTDSL